VTAGGGANTTELHRNLVVRFTVMCSSCART
jgi:hypothetical protein